MIIRKHLVIVVSIACIILNSCATKFSSSQRAALSSVKIEPTTFVTDAYRDPSGAAPEAGTQTTLAAGGGLVGALIGETTTHSIKRLPKALKRIYFSLTKSVANHPTESFLQSTATHFSARVKKIKAS